MYYTNVVITIFTEKEMAKIQKSAEMQKALGK